jgi:GPH family glycoside/pentoside/hexuronide:cation symporter
MSIDTRVIRTNALSFWVKLVYGMGDWSASSYGTLRQIFYAIFLTDVVGLEPRLGSFAALTAIIWDAINDPLIGMLSDRVRSRWGRRRPFLLFFSIPFGLSFMLLWWAPPFENQYLLAVTVTLAFMICDTLETLCGIPCASLLPELTPDYDERTTLTSFRMFFNLLASLVTAVAAPAIVDAVMSAGMTQQQGYLFVGGIFGGLAAIPFLLIFFVVRERYVPQEHPQESPSYGEILRTTWSNIPFRFATIIYMLNWITFDIIAVALPYFLVYWIGQGDMLFSANLFGISLPIESAFFAILLIVSILALPLWIWLARRMSKHLAYIIGMILWVVIQLIIFSVRPGQVNLSLWMGLLAGISVSAAHILPDAMFPDVIEWDELKTRRRQEGIYYGVKNFIRKLTGGFAIFICLQVLGWFGYRTPPEGATSFMQSTTTLTAIRILLGPVGAVLLAAAILTAVFYPLTRKKHARIRKLLEKRNRSVIASQ